MNTNLESEYYIITGLMTEEAINLKSDQKNRELRAGTEYINHGRPLFYSNAFEDENRTDGLNEYGKKEIIKNIMFKGSSFIIDDHIKDILINFNVNAVQYYPAIYTDLQGNYHEYYWFVNVYEKFDWCDLDRSILDEFSDEEIALGSPPEAEKIALNFHKMLLVPEEERLIFKISNIANNYVYIHKKIKDILEPLVGDGARFYRVDQYEAYMEFMED